MKNRISCGGQTCIHLKTTPMSISDYIENNWNDTYFSVSFPIQGYRKRLDYILKDNKALYDELKPVFDQGSLSREQVLNWPSNEPYQRFLASMLWGGISTLASKRKASNAELAFSKPKEEVAIILNNVSLLLQEGKEAETFEYLFKGSGQIPGIGVSYLTKIMYFFCPKGNNESLIFDKWGRFMHAALLIEDPSVDVKDYYSFKRADGFRSELISKKSEKELYMDYLTRMRGVKDRRIPSPGHLEAFLFGRKLYKNNQNNTNPRYYIYQSVVQYYAGQKRPKAPAIKAANGVGVSGTNDVYLTYRSNSNGRQLVYPKELSVSIKECWAKNGTVKLVLDGLEITIDPKKKDYGVFRQHEVNAWASNREKQGTLKDKDRIPASIILSPAID